jgi:hypothetical protein
MRLTIVQCGRCSDGCCRAHRLRFKRDAMSRGAGQEAGDTWGLGDLWWLLVLLFLQRGSKHGHLIAAMSAPLTTIRHILQRRRRRWWVRGGPLCAVVQHTHAHTRCLSDFTAVKACCASIGTN